MLILWIVFQEEDDDADIKSVDFPKLICWNCIIMDGPAMLHG